MIGLLIYWLVQSLPIANLSLGNINEGVVMILDTTIVHSFLLHLQLSSQPFAPVSFKKF